MQKKLSVVSKLLLLVVVFSLFSSLALAYSYSSLGCINAGFNTGEYFLTNYATPLASLSQNNDPDCESGIQFDFDNVGSIVSTSSASSFNSFSVCLPGDTINQVFPSSNQGGNPEFLTPPPAQSLVLQVPDGQWACSSAGQTAWYYFFMYIDEPITQNFGFFADDDGWLNIYKFNPDTLSLDSKCLWRNTENDGQDPTYGICSLSPGWYFTEFTLKDQGGPEYLWFFLSGGDASILENKISYFGTDPVQERDTRCAVVGGDYIQETDGVTYNLGTGVNDQQYACCGDHSSDEGYINGDQRCDVDAGSGEYFWNYFSDICLLDDDANQFMSSLVVDYTATGGADGCCGDDPNADYVYIDGTWTFMCNNDLNPNSQEILPGGEGNPNWVDATLEQYRVRTQSGTDYISNGDEWFQCRPSDTTDGNNLIGTTETLPPSQLLSFDDTCVGFMNQLVQAGAFSNIPGDTWFVEGGSSNNQQDYVCDPNADNDPANFFNVDDAFSCVNACYTTNGQTVAADIGANQEDALITNLCLPGINIPGCPDATGGAIDPEDILTIICIANPDLCLDAEDYESNACETIQLNGDQGYLCQDTTSFCTTGEYFLSNDHDPQNAAVCCRAPIGEDPTDVCVEQPIIETSAACSAYGGEWTDDTSSSICISAGDADGDNCCIDGSWFTLSSTIELEDASKSFICSAWGSENRFTECCGNNRLCHAALEDSLYSNPAFTNGVYVAAGGTNFLVENFDKYEAGVLQDLPKRKLDLRSASSLVITVPTTFQNNHRAVGDWRGFEFLEFDVMYGVHLVNNPYTVTVVYDDFLGNEQQFSVLLAQYLVDGVQAKDMHHAMIPLPTNNNIANAKQIIISTTNVAPVSILVDDIYISGGQSNSPTYYCTGNFGTWVDNLDGLDDDGFDIDTPLVEYGEFREACNAVDSFGWTGRLCCGDDTTNSFQENYVDELAGCFEGNKISDNKIVGETIYNEEHNDLLFFDKLFHQCAFQPNDATYSSYTNTHGNYPQNLNSAFVQVHTGGETIGVYECVITNGVGEWVQSPELFCEVTGQHDYLSDDELNPLVLAVDGYNLTPEARCCLMWDVNDANDDLVNGDSGTLNGDFECAYHPDTDTYTWESNIAGSGGFCEAVLGGASLQNFDQYVDAQGNALSPEQACCIDSTLGTTASQNGETIFVCLQDELPSQTGYTTVPSSDADYYWWNARTNTHQVHITPTQEIISVGESWLACTIDVGLGESPPTEPDPYCLDTMLYILDDEGFEYLQNDSLLFTTCDGTNNEYCCNDVQYQRNNFISTQADSDANDPSTWTTCDAQCYVRPDETLYAYRNQVDEDTGFNTYIVQNLPNEAFSIEQTTTTSNDNGNTDGSTSATDEPLWNTQCLNYDGDEEGTPQICPTTNDDNRPVCIGSFSFSSIETLNYPDAGVCCVGEGDSCRSVPTPEESTEQLCDDYNGHWYTNEDTNDELTANDVCSSDLSSGNCCFNGQWELAIDNIAAQVNPSISEGFICHQRGEQNWFSECCVGPDCDGLQPTALFNNIDDSDETPLNGLYSLGDSSGTLENFDVFTTNNVEKSYFEGVATSSTPLQVSFENNGRTVGDLSGANGLYFNIIYNADYGHLIKLIDSQDYEAVFNFHAQQITTQGTFVWNTIYLDLNNPQSVHPLFDWSEVLLMEVSVSTPNPVTIQLDTIRIVGDGEYYCAGDFGSWIGDLDGLQDSITTNNLQGNDVVLETIKYQNTCKAAGHTYGWTGSLCCGDDTTSYNAEYYAENQAGCFDGFKVISGDVAGTVVNQEENNHILFYQGAYYRCDEGDAINRTNITVYYDVNTATTELLVPEENRMAQFDTVGSFMCTPDGTWLGLGEISKSKLLASKLYDLIKDEDSYAIHCDTIDQVSDQELDASLDYFDQEVIDTFCAAQIYETNGPSYLRGNRSILGFSIDDDIPINEFLATYANYAASLHLIENTQDDIEAFASACDSVSQSTPDEFFLSCTSQGQGNSIRILYNPNYNVLFVSQVKDANTDFSGLFVDASLRDYAQSILHFFVNIFTGWYTERTDEIVDRRLPELFRDSDYDLGQIIIKGERMANGDYKEITAFIEEDAATSQNIMAAEFTNFETNVQPLAYRYYGPYNELNYMRGTNRQVIQINTELANQRKYSFEPDFDWRLFTAALRLDANFNNEAAFITGQVNDGILDIGEDCDLPENSYEEVCTTTSSVLLTSTSCVENYIGPVSIAEFTKGNSHSCYLTEDGTVGCFGTNFFGQQGDGNFSPEFFNTYPLSYVQSDFTFNSLSSGVYSNCAVLVNGSVACWGSDQQGILGDGFCPTCGSDPTVNQATPVLVNSPWQFSQVSLYSNQACGLLVNGSVACWGWDYYGQVGNGAVTGNQYSPVLVNSSWIFSQVSSGDDFNCGLLVDGSVACWGRNTHGQIGIGYSSTQGITNPTLVDSPWQFSYVEADYFKACGLLVNGSVACWGQNAGYSLGEFSDVNLEYHSPTLINTPEIFTQITVDSTAVCGLTVDDTIICWGEGDSTGLDGNGFSTITSPGNFEQIVLDGSLSVLLSNGSILSQASWFTSSVDNLFDLSSLDYIDICTQTTSVLCADVGSPDCGPLLVANCDVNGQTCQTVENDEVCTYQYTGNLEDIVYKDVVDDGIPQQSTTCGEWNPEAYGWNAYADVQVGCINGLIDYTACNYCGDGVAIGSEQCDDGNVVSGDGCSDTCQLEFCGDGIVADGLEMCDDGNQVTEEYTGELCTVAMNCDETCTYYSPCLGDAICQDGFETCQDDPLGEEHIDCGYCDADGDGYRVATAPGDVLDCNDNNASIYPGATEMCDYVDNNCNNIVDEGLTTIAYEDFDADGYGNATSETMYCTTDGIPAGYTDNTWDCNDADSNTYPGATEMCDGVDNNCVDGIDDEVYITYYEDADGDGYGNSSASIVSCETQTGYTTVGNDCNDNADTAYPGGTEICGDGLDNNCNGLVDDMCLNTCEQQGGVQQFVSCSGFYGGGTPQEVWIDGSTGFDWQQGTQYTYGQTSTFGCPSIFVGLNINGAGNAAACYLSSSVTDPINGNFYHPDETSGQWIPFTVENGIVSFVGPGVGSLYSNGATSCNGLTLTQCGQGIYDTCTPNYDCILGCTPCEGTFTPSITNSNPFVTTCFTAGTSVLLADGSSKPIESVLIGDVLKGETSNNVVLAYHQPELGDGKLYSINKGPYFVTEEHPFMTTDGWKAINPEKTKLVHNLGFDVGNLEEGDVLITIDGKVQVTSIDSQKAAADTPLYNFVLTGDQTYYADGYLVHNKNEACTASGGSFDCSSPSVCASTTTGNILFSGTGYCSVQCNNPGDYVINSPDCNYGDGRTEKYCGTDGNWHCGLPGIASSPETSCEIYNSNPTLCGITQGCTWNNCGAAVCGNGIIETGEQCDDGNTVDGDDCSSTCQVEGLICDESSFHFNLLDDCLVNATGQQVSTGICWECNNNGACFVSEPKFPAEIC